ncbi:hypothetical protein QBC35DRAFT_85576 [Podospora australis]|uniref:Uncharacterized protein n=1 Tax=Podospora australis TaxID=1536484 RepID=A0AAN6WKL4_9PEZI|nr:hypothetical protein QBC35DRAFT_85576 [Podospora australis]
MHVGYPQGDVAVREKREQQLQTTKQSKKTTDRSQSTQDKTLVVQYEGKKTTRITGKSGGFSLGPAGGRAPPALHRGGDAQIGRRGRGNGSPAKRCCWVLAWFHSFGRVFRHNSEEPASRRADKAALVPRRPFKTAMCRNHSILLLPPDPPKSRVFSTLHLVCAYVHVLTDHQRTSTQHQHPHPPATCSSPQDPATWVSMVPSATNTSSTLLLSHVSHLKSITHQTTTEAPARIRSFFSFFFSLLFTPSPAIPTTFRAAANARQGRSSGPGRLPNGREPLA